MQQWQDFTRQIIGALCWILSLCAASNLVANHTWASNEAEVVHWWYKGGDSVALQSLVVAFEQAGGNWIDAAETDFYTTRESVVSRLAKGYPPTATQWNAGVEIIEFAQLGLLNPLSNQKHVQHLREHYHQSVLDQVTVNNQIIAVPLNVHNESWMWTSQQVFEQTKLQPPATFEALIHQASTLEPLGIKAIAVGEEAWQQRILFIDVLISKTSKDGFNRLFKTLDPNYLDSEDFTNVISTFTTLSRHAHSFGDGSWSDQVAAVLEGKAALLFMGDWAKGEFQTLGGKIGTDFSCVMAPGVTQLQPVIDVFMLGGTDDLKEQAAQDRLVDALLQKQAVIEFNKIKGSVPPFQLTDRNDTDHCESKSLQLLQNNETVLPPFASLGDGRFAGLLQNAIRALWNDGMDGWPEARALFRDALHHEHERRKRQGNELLAGSDND